MTFDPEHSLKCIHDIPSLDCMRCPNIRSTQIPRKPKMPKSFPAISTIFTNLDNVLINGLRLNCKTVVVSDDPDLHKGEHRRYTVAGYGTSCVWKVFDMHVGPLNEASEIFVWTPRDAEKGSKGQIRRGFLKVAPLHGDQTWLDMELIATYPGARDLGIQVTTIKGAWTPGQIDGDWSKHCERVGAHVFDSAMKAVEATAEPNLSPINALVVVALQPDVARGLLDDNGLMFRKKV